MTLDLRSTPAILEFLGSVASPLVAARGCNTPDHGILGSRGLFVIERSTTRDSSYIVNAHRGPRCRAG